MKEVWHEQALTYCALGLTRCLSPSHVPAQAVKQDLSEVFAAYLSFATELEEQSKQLLKKLEEASYLHGCYEDKVQSKYQETPLMKFPQGWRDMQAFQF